MWYGYIPLRKGLSSYVKTKAEERYTKAIKLLERLEALSPEQNADIKSALDAKDKKRLAQIIKELELV